MPKKNTAFNVSLTLYKTDGTLIGNPGTITAKISKDYGNYADVGTVTEEDSTYGQIKLALTATEMNADVIDLYVTDSAVATCVPWTATIYTTPEPADVTHWLGTAVATPDTAGIPVVQMPDMIALSLAYAGATGSGGSAVGSYLDTRERGGDSFIISNAGIRSELWAELRFLLFAYDSSATATISAFKSNSETTYLQGYNWSNTSWEDTTPAVNITATVEYADYTYSVESKFINTITKEVRLRAGDASAPGHSNIDIDYACISYRADTGTHLSTSLDYLYNLSENVGTPSSLGSGANLASNMTDIAGATFSSATDALDASQAEHDATQSAIAAVSAQVAGIGSGTGAALNFGATTDSNVVSPLGPTGQEVTRVGTQGANGYSATFFDNSAYEIITNDTNNIDWVWKFDVGPGRNASKVSFNGYLAASNPATAKSVNFYAYNWQDGNWNDLIGVVAGQAGTTDVTRDFNLLARNTGTGADAGIVFIRATATGQAGAVLNVDLLTVAAQNLGQTVGYANGSIWVNAAGTGTTPYVHGTADNPTSWANALTLSSALGIKRFTATPGTSITLGAALTGAVLTGRSYVLALGSQNVSSSYFEGVEGLSGTGTCATGEAIFVDCHLGATSIGEADFVRCHLMGEVTMTQASVPYRFHDCTGITSAKITFSAADQSAVVSRVSGVLTIAGMVGTNVLYLDGDGDVTLDATNTGGTVYLSGAIRLTNSGTGQTIYRDDTYEAGSSVSAPVLYSPTASQVLVGSGTGDYTNLASRDDNPFVIDEDGDNGLEVTVTLGTSDETETPSLARIRGFYGGPQQHEVFIQAYNYTNAEYDTLAHMHNRDDYFDYVVPLNAGHQNGTGEMKLRFLHSAPSYNPGDALTLDWVSFEKLSAGGSIASDVAQILALIGAPADLTVSRDISGLPTKQDMADAMYDTAATTPTVATDSPLYGIAGALLDNSTYADVVSGTGLHGIVNADPAYVVMTEMSGTWTAADLAIGFEAFNPGGSNSIVLGTYTHAGGFVADVGWTTPITRGRILVTVSNTDAWGGGTLLVNFGNASGEQNLTISFPAFEASNAGASYYLGANGGLYSRSNDVYRQTSERAVTAAVIEGVDVNVTTIDDEPVTLVGGLLMVNTATWSGQADADMTTIKDGLVTLDGNVDSILEDTSTTLPASLLELLNMVDKEATVVPHADGRPNTLTCDSGTYTFQYDGSNRWTGLVKT